MVTVPAGATTVSADWGIEPQAAFFFGTNFTTEDAIDTGSWLGMFRGMVAPQWDDPGTLVQHAASVIPPGNAHAADDYAVLMLDTSGDADILYRATATLTATGVDLSFDTGAAGGYKIVCLMLRKFENVVAVEQYDSATHAFGFRAKSALAHGVWAGPIIDGDDRTQEWYGGGAYPPSSFDWRGAHAKVYSFPPSFAGQFDIRLDAPTGTTPVISEGGSFIGPFFSADLHYAYPTGTGLEDFYVAFANSGGMLTAWDGESWTGFAEPAQDEDGEESVTGLTFPPGCVVGYSVSNEPRMQGSGAGDRGAIGFSVITRNFQWCALVDGNDSTSHPSFGPAGSFQSFQRGFCDVVTAATVHAGTVRLTADGFTMTTQEDTATTTSWVYHAFEGVTPGWVPQIYRRVVPG